MDISIDRHTLFRGHRHIQHRRDFTIGTLSQTTTIIVIACAGLAGIIMALALFRLLSRNASRSRSAPLPPRQELAHRRDHRSPYGTEDKPFYAHDRLRSHRWLHIDTPVAGISTTSLIPAVSASVGTHEASSSELDSEITSPPVLFAHLPRPSSAPTSAGSSSGHASPLPPPHFPSPGSSRNASPSRRMSRAASASASRVSSRTSLHTSTHRSGYRPPSSRTTGVPHAPHSNVEIVLPAPLAPEVYQHMVGAEDRMGRPISQAEGSRSRSSVAMSDPWVGISAGITSNTQSSPPQQRIHKKRRSPSYSRPAPPSSSTQRSSSVPPKRAAARPHPPDVPIPSPHRKTDNHSYSASYGVAR